MRTFDRADGRYFVIYDPIVDLLGTRVVMTANGNRRTRMGRLRTIVEDRFDMEAVVKRRLRHGYYEIEAMAGQGAPGQ